jgi:hypothetical protein
LFNNCKLLKPTLDIETKYTDNAAIYDLHGYAAKLAKSTIPVLEFVNGYPTLLI